MKIVFLSLNNSVRSQIAKGLLDHHSKDHVEVYSAGVNATGINPLAIEVMNEIGLDISGFKSRLIKDMENFHFDMVIAFGEHAKRFCLSSNLSSNLVINPGNSNPYSNLFVGAPVYLYWNVEKPDESSNDPNTILENYRLLRDEINNQIKLLLDGGYLTALSRQRILMDDMSELLEDGLVAHDDYRRIFLFNDAAAKITEIPKEKVLGRDCHEIFPPNGLCGSHCRFKEGPSFVKEKVQYNVPVVDGNGRDKMLRVSAKPLCFEGDTPKGALALINDVTEIEELRFQQSKKKNFHGIIAASGKMNEIFATIRSVATSDYPVYISGESGTGKELAARAIHKESRRSEGPFVPINCGALPENILESELFGHVRGAFTGAIREKSGRFELANNGTLFLDEVGELTSAFQVKLLRVLQEKQFEKVGGESSIKADVRIVCATNRDLQKMVDQGKFREDLFYRLCVVPIKLPPLRDRIEDLPHLVNHIIEEIISENMDKKLVISPETMDVMMSYDWPGNIRQLINVIQFASIRSNGTEVKPQHLPPEIHNSIAANKKDEPKKNPSAFNPATQKTQNQSPAKARRKRKLNIESVQQALNETQGNKKQAAKVLGVGRATLYRFLGDNGML